MDHTENRANLSTSRHSPYSLWPNDKHNRNALRSTPLAFPSSKENLPLWHRPPSCTPIQSKAPILSAAPSLNVQRLRARPSLDIGIQKLACNQADTFAQQHSTPAPAPRPESKRRKSIHKRVISKVKDGVLSRSKSSSKFFGTTGLDEHNDKDMHSDSKRHGQQRLSKTAHHETEQTRTAEHTVKSLLDGQSKRSLLESEALSTLQSASSG